MAGKLRCEVHLGELKGRVLLVPRPEEKLDHLALKLAAFVMFLPLEPVVEPSSDHPSLRDWDLRPDLFALDEAGDIRLWVECGEVSLNKLDKVSRRLHGARIVVLKRMIRQAKQLREVLAEEISHGGRIEIWTWPDGQFEAWMNALAEKTEIFGEAHEKSFNLVVNSTAYAVDLIEL